MLNAVLSNQRRVLWWATRNNVAIKEKKLYNNRYVLLVANKDEKTEYVRFAMNELSMFSFLTGYGKVKTVKDVSEAEKRKELVRYFEYDQKILKSNKLIEAILGVCGFLLFIGATTNEMWCFAAAVVCMCLLYFTKVAPVISDAQYYEWLSEDQNAWRAKAMEELLITDADLVGPSFAVRSSYKIFQATKKITDSEIISKIGSYAYAPIQYYLIFELEKQIISYRYAFEIRNNVINDKRTTEFFYKDIVDVSTDKIKDFDLNVSYNAIRLRNAGASELIVPLDTPDDAEENQGNVLITGDVDKLISHIRQNVRKFKV